MYFVNLYGTNDKKETQNDDATCRLRHQYNARVRVKDTGLLWDAIQLA